MTGSESSSTQSTGKGQSSLQQKQQNCKIKPSLEQKERECESESSLQQECPSKQQECKSENNLQQLKREPTLQQEYKRGQILSSSDDLRRMAIKNCSRESIKKSLLSPESLSTIPRKALPVSRTSTTPLKSTPAVECSTFKSKIPLNFIDKWPGSSASKTVPYRSQHEVLRRTYSNSVSGMHMTPTICNGSSSYIYHTPRNIRRNYRPRAPLNRITASSTPLGYRSTEYDMYGDDDDDDEDETKSMVELHHSRPLSPDDDLESSLQRGTGCMTPPCRNSLSLHMPLLGMESHTSSHRNHNQVSKISNIILDNIIELFVISISSYKLIYYSNELETYSNVLVIIYKVFVITYFRGKLLNSYNSMFVLINCFLMCVMQYEFWHASNSRQAHASHLPGK